MSFQIKLPRAVEVNPTRFYRLADMAKSLDESTKAALEVFVEAESNASQELEKDLRELASANTRMEAHIRQTTRTNAFDPTKPEDFDDRYGKIKHSVSGNSFLGVIFSVMDYINEAQKLVLDTARGVRPAPILIVGNMLNAVPSTVEELQLLSMQMEMNDGAINNFVNGVLMAELTANVVVAASREIVSVLDGYYSALVKRHSTGGVQIYGDPVTTDLAISIFENIDLNGEIQDGRKPDEVSAFSVRKAITIIEAIQNSMIGDFIKDPASLINQIQSHLRRLWKSAETLAKVAKPLAESCRQILGSGAPRSYVMTAHEFDMAVNFLSDLDPTNISYKDKTGLLSVEERREMGFQNETLKGIVDLLAAGQAPNAIVQYVLGRKAELRAYHLEENSFYVCRIGTGNPFTGDAPGQLSVVPGIKPTVKLDEVVGSGFDEVKSFISNVTSGAKWFDLFVATSPSKKADKSNVLLVGPQGCGKTEVLRAVASDRQSIGIFAQASDFLTCWKGESEKNPKRLFEEGLRLQKESKKQVFFLIDEIDTILNGDRGQAAFGGTNLATEFQVLMDGITSYPHLALWGATNHPERIPMPLIRRFAKVVIVGELDQADRIKLLKQFTSFLPISEEFPEEAWENAATKLDGAVGDIMRKVVDGVWREKMGTFVSKNPDEAEKLVNWLNDKSKFSVSSFDAHRRIEFKNRLRSHVQVSPKDLHDSIDQHLRNVAIRGEIETAKETYERARNFLSEVNAR